MSFNTLFEQALNENNMELSEDQIRQLCIYSEEILDVNQHLNLTAIREEDSFIYRNLIDSLVLVPYIDKKEQKIADVGTGGGFPGIPLAAALPEDQFTLIDSTDKKLNAVLRAAEKAEIHNIRILNGRAEEIGKMPAYREQFDYVVSRAVASLRILSELCLPLIKVGGKMLALKSAKYEEEIEEAKTSIEKLGGKIIQTDKIRLMHSDMLHVIITIEKICTTPSNYPRNFGQIKKKSL